MTYFTAVPKLAAHPFRSKVKSPMPAMRQPATTRTTDAVMSRGGALRCRPACRRRAAHVNINGMSEGSPQAQRLPLGQQDRTFTARTMTGVSRFRALYLCAAPGWS